MVPPGIRIAFVHPDLGLGGAERLIVDAATELVKHGGVGSQTETPWRSDQGGGEDMITWLPYGMFSHAAPPTCSLLRA